MIIRTIICRYVRFLYVFYNIPMKKHLIPVAAVAAAILSATAANRQADPIVMTVNGKDIKQSEFEYLYNKNNLQQATPQSLEEYVDMFVVYKLKVADAEAAGLDTTATFRDEYNGYCAELSAPYLRDSLMEQRLVNEAYDHMSRSRNVSHIMMPIGSSKAEREANRARLDSIRKAIVAGADFGEMAVRYSCDGSAVRNHGSLGYIMANQYPYLFEKAAYETPVGEISEVFEDAPYGYYHIVKVIDERPATGDVSARHILKLTQGLSPEEAAVKKAQIDSIAALLKNGADFEALARAESEDPGSARQGGNLGFFGRGVMVPQFEAAAYSLKPGEISEPFATAYGYHIVQTLDYKPLPTLDEARAVIDASMRRDGRALLPHKEYLANIRKECGVTPSASVLDKAYAIISGAASQSEALAALAADTDVIASFPSGDVKVSDVAKRLGSIPMGVLSLAFEQMTDICIDESTEAFARTRLQETDADYRNLVNEYRDGILLFEISNRKVWDRSSTDTDAQKAYFAAHRSNYTWDAPRFKGYVVFATSDSVASEAKGYLASTSIASDSLAYAMNERFGREVKVERVLTAKGDNAIIDQIAFGGENAKPVGKWVAWFPYGHKVIESPEEASDVKAALATDLQQQLEAEWIKELRGKYKVKINKKTIKKLNKKD